MVKNKLKRGLRMTRYVIYRETLVDTKEHIYSFVGSFIGIAILAFIQSKTLADIDSIFLIGSFGASSVLIFGAVQSPLAQPRNLIGGHVISAIIGVTIYKTLPNILWLTAPLAVSLSIVMMQLTKTLHPPGGAAALIAIIGTDRVKQLGYLYVLSPVLTGTLILLAVALVFNNITPNRKYPTDRRFTNFLRKRKADLKT
ncbi:HPP family protein [Emticicia sediminis]|jgi:CBS-domain-containing membrane protein